MSEYYLCSPPGGGCVWPGEWCLPLRAEGAALGLGLGRLLVGFCLLGVCARRLRLGRLVVVCSGRTDKQKKESLFYLMGLLEHTDFDIKGY